MFKKSVFIVLAVVAILSGKKCYAETGNMDASCKKETMQVKIKDGQIEVISNIIYSQVYSGGSCRQLRMTLLLPKNKIPKPAVIFFPGGGFTSANHERYIEMRMALAKAGFVVAAAEYRVVPDKYPAPVVDAKSAVRYLRAHAEEFGIDSARIGVLGDSAGGYVAQMAGTTNGEKEFEQGDFCEYSSDVQAAVTIYGISNLLNIGEGYPEEIRKVHASPAVTEALLLNGPAFAGFAGNSILSDPQKAVAASPIGHVKEKMPPFLIMHGSEDRLVSPVQSEQLYEALKEKKNKVDYVIVEGAGHGDLYWYQQPVIDKVVNWFVENLK